MAKYRRQEPVEEIEEVLENQETPENNEPETPEEIVEQQPVVDKDEETFKKRYGDLRRREQALLDQLKELEGKNKELEKAAASQIDLSEIASPEDAREWVGKYPEIAKVFRFLAQEQTEELKTEITDLKEMKRRLELQTAYMKLLDLHPDFETLKDDPKFREWVEEKGGWVKQALNGKSVTEAADAISLYKSTVLKETKTPPKKKDSAQDAESVTKKNGSAPDIDENQTVWSESFIEEQSKKDKNFFDKNYDEIMKAIRSGKFTYDVTGQANA